MSEVPAEGSGTATKAAPSVPINPDELPPLHPKRSLRAIKRGEGKWGWIFVIPAVIILGIFVVYPIFMGLWVSFLDWNGQGARSVPTPTSSGWTTTRSCSSTVV